MEGFRLTEELYNTIGHRTTACTLVLENGYEITGTHCLGLGDLCSDDSLRQKAFKNAFAEYEKLLEANRRNSLYKKPFVLRTAAKAGEKHGEII